MGRIEFNQSITKEDVRNFFETRITEIENKEFDRTEKAKDFQILKRCDLNDLDMNNTYFHFTDKVYLESITDKGLISNVGKHSKGIDEKPSIFFSTGIVATVQGADVWIKWVMHRMYGEKNQFHIYDGLDESSIKLKQSEWASEFLNKEYLSDNERKEKAFELIFDSLKEKIFFAVNLKHEKDFSFDDIDYNKQRALISKENGNMIPYLFMKEMYGAYSDSDSVTMDKWNMHTFIDTQVEPERIIQITDSKERTDMLHILIEMYDRCKSKDCQLDILDDFISYAKQREFVRNQISTQELGKQVIRIIENTSLEDEYEQAIDNQQRIIQNSKDNNIPNL